MRNSYYMKLLVEAEDWGQVITITKDDLSLENRKQNASDINMQDHFIVGLKRPLEFFNDEFYEKIKKSEKVTVVFDEASNERGAQLLKKVAPIELGLRLFVAYAHTLATKYREEISKTFKNPRSKSQKKNFAIADSGRMVLEDDCDSLTSKLMFGQLLSFLRVQGNEVDTKDYSDQVEEILDKSSSFKEFKELHTERFKKFTFFDLVAPAILEDKTITWGSIQENLNTLKDLRNKAAHFNVVTPNDLEQANSLSKSLQEKLKLAKTVDLLQLSEANRIINKNMVSLSSSLSQFAGIQAFGLTAVANLGSQLTKSAALGGVMKPIFPDIKAQSAMFSGLLPDINKQLYKSMLPVLDIQTQLNMFRADPGMFSISNPTFTESAPEEISGKTFPKDDAQNGIDDGKDRDHDQEDQPGDT